jgi:ATP-dependent DNA helicase RecQ
MSDRALGVLKEVFGYDEFRPHQEAIIDAALAGEDVLAVMPTGGGKSLCYQVPALVLGPGSLVVVVSPLIALMREQVAFLRALGVEARLLNSTLDADEWRANAEAAATGKVRLLYLAPETLASPRALDLLTRARIDLLAVDEAHCISEWGHDFRPEYRTLGAIRSRLKPREVAGSRRARVACLALTATATERVRDDILTELRLGSELSLGSDAPGGPKIIVAGFDRPNIFLEVKRRAKAVDQLVELADSCPEGAGIVYCFSRARAEALAADLSRRGVGALPYHAGLTDDTRSANQDAFIRDEVRVICATTAFGMGIDKPDVRFVAHADMPKSVEQYYQEIGRAGRDGLPARALLLFGYGDAMKIRSLQSDLEGDEALIAEASLRGMLRFAEASGCRRAALLAHFGEEYVGPGGLEGQIPGCGACDICAGTTDAGSEADVTTQAYKLLSCVARTGERYGAGHVVDVLLGSRNERVLSLGHAELSTWGIGKEWVKSQWLDLAAQLVRKGYLAKDEDYGVLRMSEKAYASFRDKSPIAAVVPQRPKGKAGVPGGQGSGAGGQGVQSSKTGLPKRGSFASGSRQGRLETALRSLRKRLAEEGQVPNYMIFADRTLYELVEKAPGDRAALLNVFGMGEVKAARYGAVILETIAEASALGDSVL